MEQENNLKGREIFFSHEFKNELHIHNSLNARETIPLCIRIISNKGILIRSAKITDTTIIILTHKYA